jgi:hypothetical protein
MGACKGTWKPVFPFIRLGIGLYSLFEHCLRVEMSLRYRWTFPGKKMILLEDLSPFETSFSLSFNSTFSMVALTAIRDRDDEVYSVTASC